MDKSSQQPKRNALLAANTIIDSPCQAIQYCLSEGNITSQQLDYIVFYDKPFAKFERLLETYLAFAPRGFRSFLQAMPLWIKEKLRIPDTIQK